MIETNYIIFILMGSALLFSWLAFKPCLNYARKHNIFDQPNKRKLQDHPIPVLGGVTVAIGIFVPMLFAYFCYGFTDIKYQLFVMVSMLVVGILDDMHDEPAWLRLIVEIVLVWYLVWQTHAQIDDLHGLFGRIEPISVYSALPLSILAGVGIINAINLIDGVDGYSSGYGIVANTLFAFVFFYVGDIASALFSAVTAAALVPFYLHNVFGDKSKMFIGDGGSLLIGMVMVCDVFALLTHQTSGTALEQHGVGVVALALAILCIPVFDTLRVMFARILHKQSPLWPDKTHLHHRFIALGFSHAGTSTCIVLTNLIIVGLWYLSYRLGAGITLQFWIVVLLGLLATCGFYYGTEYCEKQNNALYRFLTRLGNWSHFERKGHWLKIQNLIDKI